jgi:two-component system cell cycle sensor histidine kinase/response regulator CckA
MTARALEQRGYTVFEAESGPQALRLLDDGSLSQLHLLVTDFIMPHMRGDVLVEQVRKRYPGLKVVFISGYGDREIEAKIKSTEQALYLTKPFEPETLLAQVRLALDGRFE